MQDISCAKIDGKLIFEHEAIYALATRRPIPKGHLVGPIDGNWDNLDINNLYAVPERDNDYHTSKNRVFHEDHIADNIDFIKTHFNDIYTVLGLENYRPGMWDEKGKKLPAQKIDQNEFVEHLKEEMRQGEI